MSKTCSLECGLRDTPPLILDSMLAKTMNMPQNSTHQLYKASAIDMQQQRVLQHWDELQKQ